MSLLDLNSGKGSSPRMKRGVKIWIGAGLIAAIAGIGSTLATNINLNNGDNTEFGQGVAQTVYCGDGEANVMVTPTSTYVNSEVEDAHAAVASVWINPSWTGTPTFQEVSSESDRNRFTSNYVNDATGVSESIRGYWVSSRSSSSWYTSSSAPSSGYVFVPQAVGKSSTSYASRSTSSSASYGDKYGYWKYQSWVPGSFTAPIAATERQESEDSFELSGITISNIPVECENIDFVVSVYSSGDEDRKSIVTDCDNGHRGEESYSNEVDSSGHYCTKKVKEIAVQWENTINNNTPWFSKDRLFFDKPSWLTDLLEVKTTAVVNQNRGGSIIIKIDDDGSRLETDRFNKIVVETQDDLISN